MSSYALISENEALRKRVKELENQLGDLNKIKAEAVREAITHSVMNDNHKRNSYWAYDVMANYANKLENQND